MLKITIGTRISKNASHQSSANLYRIPHRKFCFEKSKGWSLFFIKINACSAGGVMMMHGKEKIEFDGLSPNVAEHRASALKVLS